MEGKKMLTHSSKYVPPKPKVEGLDTLKVLATKIAPGQECMHTKIELHAASLRRKDNAPHKNLVFVSGSPTSLKRVRDTWRQDPYFYIEEFHIWDFPNRSEADDFLLHAILPRKGLQYWQLGVSHQYVLNADYPLFGYFFHAMYGIDAQEEMERTEAARLATHRLLSEVYPR